MKKILIQARTRSVHGNGNESLGSRGIPMGIGTEMLMGMGVNVTGMGLAFNIPVLITLFPNLSF